MTPHYWLVYFVEEKLLVTRTLVSWTVRETKDRPVSMQLVALLIWLCSNDIKAHVLHVSLQRGFVLTIGPRDFQEVLVRAVHDGDLQRNLPP